MKKDGRKSIKSVAEFTEWIGGLEGGLFLYRGLADADWDVEASAHRRLKQSKKPSQNVLPWEFQNYITNLLERTRRRGLGVQDGSDLSDLELLAKLQHNGAATCLIDFTENPFAALWFACNKPDGNGKVVAIRTDQPEKFRELTHEQVRDEKIQNLLSEGKLYKWAPAIDVDNRVFAQQSVFIFGEQTIEKRDYKEVEINIEGENFNTKYLERYGITEESLFPDFSGFALSNAHDKSYTGYSAKSYFYIGVEAQQRGENEKAIKYYNRVIDLDLQSVATYFNRGNAKETLGDHQGAIEDYGEAIKLNPQHAGAYNNRGVAKKNLGDIQGAIEDYNEAIRIDPQHASAYNNRGVAKRELGDFQGAIEDYGGAIKLNPQDIGAYNNRGVAKKKLGDLQGAIEDYNEAIRIDPQHASAYNNRGVAKKDLGDPQGAIEDYDEAIRLNPQNANAYNNRGNAKGGLGDLQGAIEDCNEAIRLNPQNASAHNNRGVVKKNLGDLQGAIEDYEEAIRLNPKYAMAYRNRGVAKKQLGNEKGADEDFKKAKELEE